MTEAARHRMPSSISSTGNLGIYSGQRNCSHQTSSSASPIQSEPSPPPHLLPVPQHPPPQPPPLLLHADQIPQTLPRNRLPRLLPPKHPLNRPDPLHRDPERIPAEIGLPIPRPDAAGNLGEAVRRRLEAQLAAELLHSLRGWHAVVVRVERCRGGGGEASASGNEGGAGDERGEVRWGGRGDQVALEEEVLDAELGGVSFGVFFALE